MSVRTRSNKNISLESGLTFLGVEEFMDLLPLGLNYSLPPRGYAPEIQCLERQPPYFTG